MTHYLRGSCVLLVVASWAWAAGPLQAATATQPVPVTPAPEPLPAGFGKAIDYETPANATLGAVIEELRQITGANIVVSWNALEQYGIMPDTEVRLPKVAAVPVSRVLDLLLQHVSASVHDVTQLAWANQGGVITISTKDKFSESLDLRIYDVSELANLLATLDPAGGKPSTPSEQVGRIQTVIEETVQPASWTVVGGVARIQALGGQLVITQTSPGHEEVAQLLQQLREAALKASPLERHVKADDKTLGPMLEELAEEAKVGLYVNWQDLQAAGITPGTSIEVRAYDIPLRQALRLTLDSAGAAVPGMRLGYRFEDGVVIVATERHLAEILTPKSEEQKAQEAAAQIGLVDRMTGAYSDPIAAGVVAIGAIRAELQRGNQDVVASLEGLLGRTQSQGLRNALHMTLKDLYQQAGNQAKVMEHLTQMLAENDAANMTGMKSGASDRSMRGRGEDTDRGGRGEDPFRGGGGRGDDPSRGGRGG